MSFMTNQASNMYQYLIEMQNGKLRKITVVYPNLSPMPENGDRSDDLAEGIIDSHTQGPKIICQRLLSKCGTINGFKKYSSLVMYSQVNYSVFREIGTPESKTLFQIQDQDKYYQQKNQWCPDIYASTNDN